MTGDRRQRITTKRIIVAVVGLAAMLRGYGYITPTPTPDGLATLAHITGGLQPWGWAWVVVGLVAALGVFRHSQSAPLVPLVLLHVLWGGSYLAESAASGSREWITAASYLSIATLTLGVIRLVDPAEVRSRARGGPPRE